MKYLDMAIVGIAHWIGSGVATLCAWCVYLQFVSLLLIALYLSVKIVSA